MVIPNNAPNPYTFPLSRVNATKTPRSIEVVNTRTFNVSKTMSAVEVGVEVGEIRGLHWHPTQPEWSYFMQDSPFLHHNLTHRPTISCLAMLATSLRHSDITLGTQAKLRPSSLKSSSLMSSRIFP